MKLTSSAFKHGEKIPNEYTMYGENKTPSLCVEGVPSAARSLALIVDDPDAPRGTFTHWLLFNVDPEERNLGGERVPPGARQGVNDYGKTAYGGPQPPSGEHRYFFRVYALDAVLSEADGVRRQSLEIAIKGHILADACLLGKYAH